MHSANNIPKCGEISGHWNAAQPIIAVPMGAQIDRLVALLFPLFVPGKKCDEVDSGAGIISARWNSICVTQSFLRSSLSARGASLAPF